MSSICCWKDNQGNANKMKFLIVLFGKFEGDLGCYRLTSERPLFVNAISV